MLLEQPARQWQSGHPNVGSIKYNHITFKIIFPFYRREEWKYRELLSWLNPHFQEVAELLLIFGLSLHLISLHLCCMAYILCEACETTVQKIPVRIVLLGGEGRVLSNLGTIYWVSRLLFNHWDKTPWPKHLIKESTYFETHSFGRLDLWLRYPGA